jgi:hypothetical protein
VERQLQVVSCMGIFDRIRSIPWRFPKREEPSLRKRGMILESGEVDRTALKPAEKTAVPHEMLYAKKRRFPRFALEGVEIQAHMLFSEDVVLYDLSVSGVCIHTRLDIRVGGKYLINIPDGKTGRHIRCRAVWKTENLRDEDGLRGYMAGLQFENIASDEVVRLKDFMRTSGVPDDKRVSDDYEPSPLRFMIVSNKNATLKLPKILNVRQISLGGMLVDSDAALGLESRYRMKLPLPNKSAAITCQARVASVVPKYDTGATRFAIGLEFLSLNDNAKAQLDSFIHCRGAIS